MDDLKLVVTVTGGWTQETWDAQLPGTLGEMSEAELIESLAVLESIPL